MTRKKKYSAENNNISNNCLLSMARTSNLILVLLLQLELAGSFRSKPTDKRDKFTSPLPEREKLSIGVPWTPISGEKECWDK
jgi:hypothetical protein